MKQHVNTIQKPPKNHPKITQQPPKNHDVVLGLGIFSLQCPTPGTILQALSLSEGAQISSADAVRASQRLRRRGWSGELPWKGVFFVFF